MNEFKMIKKNNRAKELSQTVLFIKDRTSAFYIIWQQYVDMNGRIIGLGNFAQRERKRQCGMGMAKRIQKLRKSYREKEQPKQSK